MCQLLLQGSKGWRLNSVTLLILWLKCVWLLWFLLGTVLWIDRRKKEVRRHVASLPILALKLAFAPATLVYVAVRIHIEPLLAMWDNFTIGCYSGRAVPMPMFDGVELPGISGSDPVPTPRWFNESCSESAIRNEIARPSSPNLEREREQPPGDYDKARYDTYQNEW